jgi:hypothetical protein
MPDDKSESNDFVPGNRKPKDQKCHNGGVSKHKNKKCCRVETHQEHTDGTHLGCQFVTYLPVVLRLEIYRNPDVEQDHYDGWKQDPKSVMPEAACTRDGFHL